MPHIPTVNSPSLHLQGFGGDWQTRSLLDDTLLGRAQLRGPSQAAQKELIAAVRKNLMVKRLLWGNRAHENGSVSPQNMHHVHILSLELCQEKDEPSAKGLGPQSGQVSCCGFRSVSSQVNVLDLPY
jgi:hypothetical protein